MTTTANVEYTERLVRLQSVWWKRILDVQAPYRWNLKRLNPGITLDLGCGVGRNLLNLPKGSVGIDHNPHSVQTCRSLGLQAFTTDEWKTTGPQGTSFETLLVAHVVEHMSFEDAKNLLSEYVSYLGRNGRIILITPQEAGYKSDSTHVDFFDFTALSKLVNEIGFKTTRCISFPFPRLMGRIFKYNEFVVVAARES